MVGMAVVNRHLRLTSSVGLAIRKEVLFRCFGTFFCVVMDD